jgi:beta-lactam-binding protein with PASTA domain
MAFRTRVVGAGKLLALIGALVATFFVFAGVSMRMALRAREVEVPNLINRTADEATALAASLGLNVQVDETGRADPHIAAGRIVTQTPQTGSITRRNRSVHVWLSTGSSAATVPALVGESERTAQLQLTQAGLLVSGISEIRSSSYPSDAVVAQDPPASSAAAGVALLVNRGELSTTYVMPDLIGVNGNRAADVLRSRGFRIAVVGTTPYPGVDPGTVIRQNPQAGFQIGPGEPIALEVSQ